MAATVHSLTTSTSNDLLNIAKCHRQCFKDSLPSKLGLRYIKKTFEWFLNSPNRFLFHIVKDGEVVGYCGGFVPQYIGDGSTSGIMQYAMKQAAAGVALHPWLLFNKEVMEMYPLIFKNIKAKFLGSKKTAEAPAAVKPFDKRVGLVVVGVLPAHRGTGVFPVLMREFEARAAAFNINKLVLSVKKNNPGAIKAYTKQNWFITNEHQHTLEMCKFIQ